MWQVQCACGKVMTLGDAWLGRTVACPACGMALQIIAPTSPTDVPPQDEIESLEVVEPPMAAMAVTSRSNAADDLYEFVPPEDPAARLAPVPPVARRGRVNDGPPCPACKAPLPQDARICTGCGIDLTTGRPVNEQQTYIDKTIAAVSWFVPAGIFPIAQLDPGAAQPTTGDMAAGRRDGARQRDVLCLPPRGRRP